MIDVTKVPLVDIKLNIMNVYKTLNDYIHSISAAGFQIIDIQEASVTEEHLGAACLSG